MRAINRKLHLWLSLPLGLLFSLLCLTGALLVFEQDINAARQARLLRVTPPAKGQPLPPAELAERISRQVPDSLRLTSLQLDADPTRAALAAFDNAGRRQLAVCPYTGQIKGWTSGSPLLQTVRKLHRWLLNPPPAKGAASVGKRITGITTLAMTVVLLSGLVIWWPRSRRQLRSRLTVSTRHGKRRFWYDIHSSLGLYALPLLLVMALTGLTWSFGWYRNAVYGMLGAGPSGSPQKTMRQKAGPSPHARTAAFDYTVWNRTAAEAAALCPDARWLRLTTSGEAEVLPERAPLSRASTRLATRRPDGAVIRVEPWADRPRSQKVRAWMFALHTGAWGGTAVRILYALAALVGASLPLTGYYLWWRRRRA